MQYELLLNDRRRRIPWDGVPPRGLTRASKVLYFNREVGGVSRPIDPLQCELFIGHQARRYTGAPSLLPFL